VAGEELARLLFRVHEEDMVELLKHLRAKSSTPAVSDEQLLTDTSLRKLAGKMRRLYPAPQELEAAMRAWYKHWNAIGTDPHTMVPLFTDEMPTLFENQIEHVRQGRYSGMHFFRHANSMCCDHTCGVRCSFGLVCSLFTWCMLQITDVVAAHS
jgi:hypothetical protein